jgi:hypothetical protein
MTDAAPQLRGELRKLSAADTELAKVVSVLGGVAMIAGTTLAAVFHWRVGRSGRRSAQASVGGSRASGFAAPEG